MGSQTRPGDRAVVSPAVNPAVPDVESILSPKVGERMGTQRVRRNSAGTPVFSNYLLSAVPK